MIELEVQNETYQTQERLRFAAVPRIGEGIRLLGPDGYWASYDVMDLWYQKAEYGDVWVPYLHVRMTAGEQTGAMDRADATDRAARQERSLLCVVGQDRPINAAGKQPVALSGIGNGEATSFKA